MMSKRKTLAGGYARSSDNGLDDDEQELSVIPLGQSINKKPKVSQPMLPRLNLPSRVKNGFEYPRVGDLAHTSIPQGFSTSSSRQGASTPEPMMSPQPTSSTAFDTASRILLMNNSEDTCKWCLLVVVL
jgi:hypothetical protein